MIKAVEKIPIKETRKTTSRAQSVRDDIRFALDNKIPRFEFVGEIYRPNDIHTTFLNKSLVRSEAWDVLTHYIWTIAKSEIDGHYRFKNNSQLWPSDFFEVYRYPEPDHDRIFMEIYFDKLARLPELLKEAKA